MGETENLIKMNEIEMEDQEEINFNEVEKEEKGNAGVNISEIEQEKFVVSIWNILVLSLRYYISENTSKFVFLVVLEMMIVCKNVCNALSNIVLDNINAVGPDEQRMKILQSTALISITHVFNYTADWFFERNFSKYGSTVCALGLKNILLAKDSRINDINPTHAQFCLYEGGKSMGKVCRNVLVDIPSKSIHLLCDTIIIFWADTTKYKILFSIFLSGAIFLTVFKIFVIYKSMAYVPVIIAKAAKRNRVLQESLNNTAIVKSFNTEEKFMEKYHRQSSQWITLRRKHKFHLMTAEFLSKTLTVVFRLVVAWYYIENKPSSSTGEVLKIMTIIKILMDTVKTLEKSSELFKKMSESIGEVHQILSFLFIKRERKEDKVILTDLVKGITVRNLNYTVNNNERVIFNDVNMELKRGQWAVLYGKNGAGKSSLLKILQNYVIFNGEVLFDGIDIKKIYRPSLSRLITSVPQATSMFEGTIYFNIKFHNEQVNFGDVIRIAQQLDIHDTIMSFPDGYNTQVGMGGSRLNGGLRQKIFYARAFLRDTPIYLFDEPTNNLDVNSTKTLFDYIFNSGKFHNKLLFVICHNLDIINSFPIKYKFIDKRIIRVDHATPQDLDN